SGWEREGALRSEGAPQLVASGRALRRTGRYKKRRAFRKVDDMKGARTAFPVLRWVAAAWMVVWLPAYIKVWGWANLLHLCDAAVILTCVGLWIGSARLISSQAVSALAAGVLWTANVGARLLTGHFFASGSEYLW